MLAWTWRFSSAYVISAYLWSPGGLVLLLVTIASSQPPGSLFLPSFCHILHVVMIGVAKLLVMVWSWVPWPGPHVWNLIFAPRNFDREHPGSIYTSATADISRISLNDWPPLPLI